jgi:virginiamycin B lyase
MRTLRVLLLATVVLAVLATAPALAEPKVDGIFDLAGVQTNGQLTVGPDGNVWVSLNEAVGKVTPAGSTTVLKTGDLGNALGFPSGGITSAGGFIWVSQPGGGFDTIVKITPGDTPTATGVAVTDITGGATAMTTGPDGNVWVGLADKLVEFSPSNPASSTTYPMPGLSPKAIAAAADGTLWVTDTINGRVLHVSSTGTVIAPYDVGDQPQFIGAAPSGQVAFGNPGSDPQAISLLSPDGSPLALPRPIPADPFGVAFGADGAFWVAEFAGNRLDRVTTDGQITSLGDFPVVAGQGPRQIVAGPGNTLWATLDNPGTPANSKIARITGVGPPPAPPPPPADTPPVLTPPDATAPLVTAAKLSKTAKAVTMRFTLSEPGTATLVLSRREAGRRRGKACVRPAHRLRKARRCTRLVRVRTITTAASAGANTIQVKTRTLRKGSYSAALTVSDAAGNRSAPVTRTFKITKKQRHR